MESIRRYGVQVPIAVYREKHGYILIDGERRWRCCRKLNRSTIPALVQKKPTALHNLLLMFNIHALREQWDLLTIALKLPTVIDLLRKELGKDPNEGELAARTGLGRSVIRRCKLLMELPEQYRKMILEELKKPKSRQKITEDLFIEMERALKTVERAMPEVVPDKDQVRDVLLTKFRDDVIPNRVHFRNMAKIARADRVGYDRDAAAMSLKRLFQNNTYSIQQAYESTVSEAYSERDVLSRINALVVKLKAYEADELDEDLRSGLRLLVRVAEALLEDEA